MTDVTRGVVLVALASLVVPMLACTRSGSTAPSPPRADETCARLGALYAKENLPYEKAECLKMVGALAAEDATCFDSCTQSANVKALVACQTSCRNGPKREP